MKVLVAYDGSKQSKKALDKAAELAEKYGGVLLLLTVTEPVCPVGYTSESDCEKMEQILSAETEALLESIRKELEKKAIKVKTLVKKGNPADEIVKLADREDVDLVVVGSHGRHGAKKYLLGSVSSRVSTHAPCSVYIVK
jgi:nucleotide-binding universal stress UspA family protein